MKGWKKKGHRGGKRKRKWELALDNKGDDNDDEAGGPLVCVGNSNTDCPTAVELFCISCDGYYCQQVGTCAQCESFATAVMAAK